MNIGMALERTLRQILDPTFLRVFLLGLILTAIALGVAVAGAGWGAGHWVSTEDGWLAKFIAWLAGLMVLWLSYLLFVPISAIFIGVFLDPVVDAVEAKYYPGRLAGPQLGIVRAGWLGLRLGAIVLVANVAVIPLYILTLWIPFFAVVLFYGLNAYLLGWGFYDIVATRHVDGVNYRAVRKSMGTELLLFGLLVTVFYMVPLLNLAIPVLGTAMMVHLVHGKLADA